MATRTYVRPADAAFGLSVGRTRMLLAGFLLLTALVLRIDGISRPSLSTRELHNALLAREYQLGDGAGQPVWTQRVLVELRRTVQPVEPPLLDHVAAWGYRLTGGERLWIPRLVSALAWVVGGVFLYLIALRVTSADGALVALALYLFWPYGVLMSRFYMPDASMVALILAASWITLRYCERPSRGRLAAACSVAAVATLVKPGIALVFLVALFAGVAAAQRGLHRAIRGGALPVFVAAAALPTVAYYVYGTYIRDFLALEGDAGNRLQPHLIATSWYWSGWWHQLSTVLVFPQHQTGLAVLVVAAAAAGIAVARAGMPRAILVGLAAGYVAYAFAVAGYTPDNAYYALPVLPFVALALGALAGFVVDRRAGSGAAALVIAALTVTLVAGVGVFKGRPARVDVAKISAYRRIGEITHHTTRAVIVDERLRTPAMYWGWIVGHAWYQPSAAQDLPGSGDPFPPWIDPSKAEYLVVVDPAEPRTERRLRELTRDLPVVGASSRYVVYDVRGGRLARAASEGSR